MGHHRQAPERLLLAACHGSNVVAQFNQMRRAVEYKTSQGKDEEVQDILMKSGVGAAALGGMVVAGPTLQSALVAANLGTRLDVRGRGRRALHGPLRAPMASG